MEHIGQLCAVLLLWVVVLTASYSHQKHTWSVFIEYPQCPAACKSAHRHDHGTLIFRLKNTGYATRSLCPAARVPLLLQWLDATVPEVQRQSCALEPKRESLGASTRPVVAPDGKSTVG